MHVVLEEEDKGSGDMVGKEALDEVDGDDGREGKDVDFGDEFDKGGGGSRGGFGGPGGGPGGPEGQVPLDFTWLVFVRSPLRVTMVSSGWLLQRSGERAGVSWLRAKVPLLKSSREIAVSWRRAEVQ